MEDLISQIVKYEDGSEWVFLSNSEKERFCGFLHLQNALKESNLNNFAAAENKMAIHNRKVIYLSKYCGEKRPEFCRNLTALLDNTGFKDFTGCANLRELEDKIYIFDTEKGSFDPSVHQKIDSYVNLHDAIQACLEAKIKC